MLSAQEIANYLVTNLDAIAATKPDMYQFSILAEIGKGYDGKKINGMVRSVAPELAPLPAGYVEAKYQFVAELFVSGPTNYRYLAVNAILDQFISENQSSNVNFENGKGIVTFSLGAPKGYKVEYGVGEGVPLTFTVSVTYTENAVTSGDKHWLLDGVEIPFLSESVSVEREGISRKIYTEVYSKILLTGQTKFYSFRIPYESDTFKKLQNEILQASAVNAPVHTLTYYDGVSFTKENPYTSEVSIYRSASSTSQRPNASAYEITFSDVYVYNGKELKYYLALIDFPFDMNGDDTRYFDSTEQQTQYFENAVGALGFVAIDAPNLDGLFITKQVYRAPQGASAVSQFDLVSKNYAIIKVVSPQKTLYFYYFIENSSIGADGCIFVDLKLDTVQTYFFRKDVSFSDCLIERAHLNRFVEDENDPDKVKFISDPASKIFNAEAGLNFPKRLVSREKLKLRFTGNDEVDEWLNENIAYWVYVFIDPTHEYSVKKLDMIADSTAKIKSSEIRYPIDVRGAVGCICYPIYKNHKNNSISTVDHNIIKIKCKSVDAIPKDKNIIPIQQAQEYLETANEDIKSFYYNYKLSVYPPFDSGDGMMIDDNNLIIDAETVPSGAYCSFNDFYSAVAVKQVDSTTFYYGLIISVAQNRKFLSSFGYALPENETIYKSDIINADKPTPAFNPKLNSQNFKELVITASSGDEFAYDIQKLVSDSIVFEYSEPIQPEITKYYFRVEGGTGLYEDGTDENYTGVVGSTDTSILFRNSNYAEFLANNKNFYLQSNMKIVSRALGSAIGIGTSLATDKDKVGSAVKSGLSAGVDIATSLIDRSFTIDNMKNAPEQLKNANGNVIFNMFVTDLGLYVEKYSALDGDLKTANDFMNLYGFSFGGIANIKDYAFIRRFHNYVKAQLQSIKGNLSNAARADLRQRFADGVRFWNQDKVSYEYENYENWLTAPIRFTVKGNTYQTAPDSTWRTFVNSNNANGNFRISGDLVIYLGGYIVDKVLNTAVLPDDKIISGWSYVATRQIL